jgi:hypothetical protein
VYQAIRSTLDETMIAGEELRFQTIDAPRMVRWSFWTWSGRFDRVARDQHGHRSLKKRLNARRASQTSCSAPGRP